MTEIYARPEFLPADVTEAEYKLWLHRKAVAHVRRDRKRGNDSATVQAYKQAIHAAVVKSKGLDAYTGEQLNWAIIGTYDNEQSKTHRRTYKHQFGLLPTVDHVGDGLGEANFLICGWRMNDAKNDLTMEDFEKLCIAVLRQRGYTVTKNNLDTELSE